MLRNPISHGGLLRRGNRKGTVRRDDKEATEQIDFHLLVQTFLITSGASPRRPCDPLFARLSSAVDAPSRLFFFFFWAERGIVLPLTSIVCGLCYPLLFLQHKLSESWGARGGELVTGAQTLLLWGCCPGFCLFIYSFNKGQNACRWRLMVTWTFYHACIYSFIY